MEPLVSIIMPAYNAEKYIGEAIRSVLTQKYSNWELLIVNDGSTDGTDKVIASINDPRIRVFNKANGGIGSARNVALDHMHGEFMCGLDADDVLPPESLSSRVPLLVADPTLDIVDGTVLFKDTDLESILRTFKPRLSGAPFPELLALNEHCFMGFSWLLRWPKDSTMRFITDVTHGEDLCFYLGYAPGKKYAFVDDEVLHYRRTGHTVMSNLDGLARSYGYIHAWLTRQGLATSAELHRFREHSRMVMVRSYLQIFRFRRAYQTWADRGPFGDPYPLL